VSRDDLYRLYCLLTALGETTFAVIVETDDDLEPSTNKPADGVSASSSPSLHAAQAQSIPPWVPALSADTLRPSQDGSAVRNEPLLNVKAVETGVIDVSA
jgi:mitotic spindle assembly checkpoint protein MAD2B